MDMRKRAHRPVACGRACLARGPHGTSAGDEAGYAACREDLPGPPDPARRRCRRGLVSRRRPHRTSAPQQGPRLRRRGTRRARAARPASAAGSLDRRAGGPRARARAPQGRRARAVHRPGGAAGPQRDALLPAARREHRGVHARSSTRPPSAGPASSSATSCAARAASGSRPIDSGRIADLLRNARHGRRAADRGDRQRAHPRARRPGRRRHGHPGRQARRSTRPARASTRR